MGILADLPKLHTLHFFTTSKQSTYIESLVESAKAENAFDLSMLSSLRVLHVDAMPMRMALLAGLMTLVGPIKSRSPHFMVLYPCYMGQKLKLASMCQLVVKAVGGEACCMDDRVHAGMRVMDSTCVLTMDVIGSGEVGLVAGPFSVASSTQVKRAVGIHPD